MPGVHLAYRRRVPATSAQHAPVTQPTASCRNQDPVTPRSSRKAGRIDSQGILTEQTTLGRFFAESEASDNAASLRFLTSSRGSKRNPFPNHQDTSAQHKYTSTTTGPLICNILQCNAMHHHQNIHQSGPFPSSPPLSPPSWPNNNFSHPPPGTTPLASQPPQYPQTSRE